MPENNEEKHELASWLVSELADVAELEMLALEGLHSGEAFQPFGLLGRKTPSPAGALGARRIVVALSKARYRIRPKGGSGS